jgi:replicative DNA helicase
MDSIYSVKIEKHVLGGLIKDPKLFADVERFISEKDFINEVHQTIFCVLRNCFVNNEAVDAVVLAEKIKNIGISFKDDIDIYDYIDAISFNTINMKGVIEACRELKKLTVRRNLYHKCDDIKKFLKENGEKAVEEIISTADHLYGDLIRDFECAEKDPENLYEGLPELIEDRGENPQEDFGFSTPYEEFNRLYGGLRPGNLYAIVARPGQGKSTWILDICRKTAKKHGVKTLMLDTEMSTEDIKLRVAAAESGVSLWHLETGNWRKNPELIKKVRNSYDSIKDQCLYHYPVGNKNIDQICSFIRRFYYSEVGRGNPFILGYDYIKLTGEKVGNNWAEYQAIGDKIDKLKKLSEELNCPIITAMQMNRSGENFNRRAGAVVDDSSAISLSDRLQWFASFVAIFRRKTLDEIAEDGEDSGTHKLVPLKTRFQGRDAAGHHDLVRRPMADGTVRFTNNFLNFNVRNFNAEEVGSLNDIVNRERDQHNLDDPAQGDGDLL